MGRIPGRLFAETQVPNFPIGNGVEIEPIAEVAHVSAETAAEPALTDAEQHAWNQRCIPLASQAPDGF